MWDGAAERFSPPSMASMAHHVSCRFASGVAGWECVSSRSVQFASGKGREYFCQIVKASGREKWRLNGTPGQRRIRYERLIYFLPAVHCSTEKHHANPNETRLMQCRLPTIAAWKLSIDSNAFLSGTKCKIGSECAKHRNVSHDLDYCVFIEA